MTLMEVVTGLALASLMLAVMLAAAARHQRQLASADETRQAIELLDDWLSRRWNRDRSVPSASSITLDADGRWSIETRIVRRVQEPTPHFVVRVAITVADRGTRREVTYLDLVQESSP
ncbi:MAG TPA: hypothetical protein DCQ98_21505 [Planctomycetaceae bacterium]|nr:hypothetical protein [Planctomycetaceae bacterium]